MKRIFVTGAIIFCGFTAFSQTDDKGVVLGLERTTADAFSKHNLTFLKTAISDDAIIISENGELITKEKLLQTVQNVNSVVVSNMQARVEGSTAIVSGIETITGKDANGNAFSTRQRFTDVMLKTKGQWQIISSQMTTIQ